MDRRPGRFYYMYVTCGRTVISMTLYNTCTCTCILCVCIHVLYICEHVYVITCLQLSLAKNKGDFLGVMVMESGYGSALPTPVIAHLSKTGSACITGSAARSGQLNIGDHIISVNGINMVGMPVKVCIEQLKVSVYMYMHMHVCTCIY